MASFNQELTAIIEYFSNLEQSRVPCRAVYNAKRAILDNIAAMILGASEQDVPDISTFIQSTGDSTCSASIVGRNQKCAFLDAVFSNTSLSQVHDANDGFSPKLDGRLHPNHPGRVVIPSALGIAEHYRLSGKELISLVVMGYEAAWRLSDFPRGDPALTIVPALMCGRILNLGFSQYCNAVGLALYQIPSFERLKYTGKGMDDYSLTIGRVSRTGIEAALLAAQGFQCSTLRDSDKNHFTIDLEDLNKSYAVENLYFKPYPACRSIHGPIEAAIQLKQSYQFNIEDIESVEIELAKQGMYTAIPINKESVTRISCASNPRYMTSCALIDGEVRLKRFKNAYLKDDAVFSLVQRISVTENEDFTKRYAKEGRPCRVTIRFFNGTSISEENQYAKGAPANPMTDEEIFSKLAWYSPESFSAEKQARLIKTVLNLEEVPDVSQLMDILRFAAR